MLTATLSLTYLGAVLCYAASPKSAPADASVLDAFSPGLVRAIGIVLLSVGLALSVARSPLGQGLLVWLSMGMFAFSLLVIAAPLVHRFVPISGALALAASLIAPWL